MKNGFVFYSSFRETANKLQKEDRADFYEAIIEYSLTGVIPELTGIVDIVFTAIKTTLDNQITNYENGKKGGRPKKENPINQDEKEGFKNENNPPYENEKSYKEKEKEKEKEKDKDKEKDKEKGEREEISHTSFSFQEEIKTEPKQVINQDLKSMIEKQAKSENKVTDIINYYRDNISSRNEDVQEVASYNQILIKNYDMDKMMIGLGNYKRFLEVSKKAPMKLFFFVRDAIYNDYQVENVVTTGKNIAVVPVDLVGRKFFVEDESIEFVDNGYLRIEKDWKVTNAKNVEEMVKLVRGIV